jgi:hypothetical protein
MNNLHNETHAMRSWLILALCGAALLAQGCAKPPECECDAAITKVELEPPDAGGAALYGLVVNYSGHPTCDGGALCVKDTLPAGLTCNPSDPAYTSPSTVNPDWDCSCTAGTEVTCCYQHPLPPTSLFLPTIKVPVLVSPKAPKTVHNCASILQDFDGSYDDHTAANNESCIDSKVINCHDYDQQWISGVIDDFAAGPAGEVPTPTGFLPLMWGGYGGTPGTRPYDATNSNQYFGHTFLGLAPPLTHTLVGGTLTLAIRCPKTNNDTMTLGFSGPSGWMSTVWSKYLMDDLPSHDSPLDVPCSPSTSYTMTLNLNALPGGPASLIAAIAAMGFLDVLFQDDTGVDYLALDLHYRCHGGAAGVTPEPSAFTTAVAPIEAGGDK